MKLHIKRFEELTSDELYEIFRVRSEVFVVEQNCAYQDLDGKDMHCYHVFLKENGKIKAYTRVLDKGISFDDVSIGRVLTTKRKEGLGDKIMVESIKVAKDLLSAKKITIEAQSYAMPFYERHGFKKISDEFILDGIPHIKMELTL